jgi:hypothetical protein
MDFEERFIRKNESARHSMNKIVSCKTQPEVPQENLEGAKKG